MKQDLYKTIASNKYVLAARLLVSVVLAFSGPLSLIAQANFIDEVIRIIQLQSSFSCLIIPSLLLFLAYMLPTADIVLNYLFEKCNHSFDINWVRHVNSFIRKIPYNQYEHEDTYNKIKQVTDNNLFSSIVSYCFLLLTTGISVISYIVILVNISPVLLITVLVLFPIVGFLSAKIADKQYKRILLLNPDRRRGLYKSSILRDRDYAKDIRINNCADYLIEDWEKTQNGIDSSVLKVKLRYGFWGALILKSDYIVVFVNLLIMLFLLINKQITIGVFISISNQLLTIKVLESFKTIITQYVNIKSDIHSYKEVLDLSCKTENPRALENRTDITIEIRNLFFKYPHQDDYVLKNINLIFKPGHSYAIVGENGVGKSTLMKLLLGLYHPDSGEILVNGVNISRLSPEEIREVFGVSFQDYSKFCLSLKENILLGWDRDSSLDQKVKDCFEIPQIASSLPNGYNTVLGKKFGNSVDLSGGQWQIVSICRALAGDKRVLIFDEPTASLDPIKEVDVFKQINEIVKNGIKIFITHRLGITTQLDEIVVLKDGSVVEHGSFKELTEINGCFKEMFNKQKSLYIKGEQ